MFGLYATTGRAVTFLAPALFASSPESSLRPVGSSGSPSCCWPEPRLRRVKPPPRSHPSTGVSVIWSQVR